MIPFFNFNPVIQLFVHVFTFMKWKKDRNRDVEDDDLEMFSIALMSMRIILQYFQIIRIAMQILKFRKQGKRKRLMKPHKLIRLLRTYRCVLVMFTSS